MRGRLRDCVAGQLAPKVWCLPEEGMITAGQAMQLFITTFEQTNRLLNGDQRRQGRRLLL